MSEKASFKKDVLLTVGGQIVIMLVTFALNKVVSIKFGPAVLTEYSLLNKTAGILAFVMLACMGIALPKFIAGYRAVHDRKSEAYCYNAALLIAAVATLVVLAVSVCFKTPIVKLTFGDLRYSGDFPAMLLTAVASVLSTLMISYYRGTDRYIAYSVVQIVLALVGVGIILLYNGQMSTVVSLKSVVTILPLMALLFWVFRSYKSVDLSDRAALFSQVKKLGKYGVPRIPGEIVLFSYTAVPLIMITKTIGYEEAAGFSVAFGIDSATGTFFNYIGIVLLPYMSKKLVLGEFKEAIGNVNIMIGVYFVLSVLGVGCIHLLPKLFIGILYSAEYFVFADVVKIMIMSLIPNSMYMLLRNPIDAMCDFPVNAVNLTVSFGVICGLMAFQKTSAGFAWSFVAGYFVLGLLSLISWFVLAKKEQKKEA